MSIRTNEELDPNEGPGFGCFVWQAILFAGILLLIPVGLFTFGWTGSVLVDVVGRINRIKDLAENRLPPSSPAPP